MRGKKSFAAWIILIAVILTAGIAFSAEKNAAPKTGPAHKHKMVKETDEKAVGKYDEKKGMNMEKQGPNMPMGMPCMQGRMPGPGMREQEPADRDPIEMLLDNQKIVVDIGLTDAQIKKLRKISSESKKSIIMARAELQMAQIDIEDALADESPNVSYLDSKIEEAGRKRVETEKIAMHAELEARAVMTKEQLAKAKELMGQFQPPLMMGGNNRPCENCPMMKGDGTGPMEPGMGMGPGMRMGMGPMGQGMEMGMGPMRPGMGMGPMGPDMGPGMGMGMGPGMRMGMMGRDGFGDGGDMKCPRMMDRGGDGCPCENCPCMKNRDGGQDMKCPKMMGQGNNQDSNMEMKDSGDSEPCPFHKDGGKKYKLGKGEDQ